MDARGGWPFLSRSPTETEEDTELIFALATHRLLLLPSLLTFDKYIAHLLESSHEILIVGTMGIS